MSTIQQLDLCLVSLALRRTLSGWKIGSPAALQNAKWYTMASELWAQEVNKKHALGYSRLVAGTPHVNWI